MPARKSDARRSDVSTARFVLVDDDPAADEELATTAPVSEPAPAPTTTTEPPAAAASSSVPPPSVAPTSPERKDKEKDRDALTIEDLNLPKSIITRLAKGVLPPNTQIQANAILALSKSATVFINHLATNANEFTLSAGKKTINPPDVFRALDEIEFGFMRERLEAEFAKFNEVQTSKRSTYRKKVAAMKKAGPSGGNSSIAPDASMLSMGSQDMNDTETSFAQAGGADTSHPRLSKKARIDPAGGDESRMEVDDHEPSDAETVPDEHDEEEDEEDDEEEEEEDEDNGDDDNEADEGDETEDRAAHGEDEALDDEDSE